MGQGLFTDPHHVGGETVCWLQGRAVGILPSQHISAGDVDLVIEGDGHRLVGDGCCGTARAVPVVGDDPVHSRRSPRISNGDLIARGNGARDNRSRVAAEVALRANDELHREAKTGRLLRSRGLPIGQELQQGGAGVPRHALRTAGDVIPGERTHRDGSHLWNTQSSRGRLHRGDDVVEGGLFVVDQIHLVHRNDDRRNSHQGTDGQVPVRLRANTTSGVDEQNRDVAVGSSHRHVPGVLLVPRRIGNEHPPTVGQIHVSVGHVDGDALFALGFQAIGQQGEVDFADRDRRTSPTSRARVFELIDRNRVGFGEQTADQRRLTVVDGTAGHQVQDRSRLH